MVKHIHIETTSKCNARCSFCPHSGMKRAKEVMPEMIFKRIVEDLRDWFTGAIYPFYMGEMFLDPLIFERLDILSEFASGFNIFTNGSLLTEARLNALKNYNIGSVHVSLQATSPEQHQDLTGLKNWNHILTMIQKIQPTLGVKPWLIFNDYLPAHTCAKLAAHLGAQHLMAYTYTWRGAKDSHHKGIPKSMCQWVRDYMFILANGEVVPCCMDYEGQGSVGNIMDASMEDLHAALEKYRKGPRAQLDLCKNCNMP